MTESNIDKKIVDTPTHQTNPDLIVSGDLEKLLCNFSERTPINFATAREISAIQNTYLLRDNSSFKQKLAKFNSDPENRLLILWSSLILLPVSSVLLIIGATELPISNIITTPIAILFILALIIGIINITKDLETPKFLLSRKDKKVVTKSEFITMPATAIQRIDPYYTVYTHNVQYILGHDKEILDTLNLSELRQAYDSYVDLFVFLKTNEDAISSNLYNEYRNEVRRRGNQLNSEIVTITTLIKEHKESQKELTSGQYEITQDMLDADALRAMPLTKPEDADRTT